MFGEFFLSFFWVYNRLVSHVADIGWLVLALRFGLSRKFVRLSANGMPLPPALPFFRFSGPDETYGALQAVGSVIVIFPRLYRHVMAKLLYRVQEQDWVLSMEQRYISSGHCSADVYLAVQ